MATDNLVILKSQPTPNPYRALPGNEELPPLTLPKSQAAPRPAWIRFVNMNPHENQNRNDTIYSLLTENNVPRLT